MQELAGIIKEFMLKQGETISVAESLTSGYLQAHMSAIAGSSKYFVGGITAYNIDIKVKFLNVDRANAETCDCVSEQTAVEMAKDWRTDRALRKLEALLTIADAKTSLIISGTGDVIEPEFDLMAIGSGGAFAQAAARALLENTNLSAREIVERSLNIAADICIYTNHNLRIEELDAEPNE